MKKIIIFSVIFLIFLGACNTQKKLSKQDPEQQKIKEYLKTNKIKAKPTESGLYYIETQEGTGEQAHKGDVVRVHYTGKLLDGTKFDSSYDRNEPFEFKLGAGQVIKGWDEGIGYMKEGGKATLIIPSKLGYGNRAVGGVIPANSTLIFDVELVEIKK